MRKIIVMVCIVSILACCLGCGERAEGEERRRIGDLTLDIDTIKANKIMLELWDAIEKRDAAAVSEMLSQNAKGEIEDYEGKIQKLLDAFGGDIVDVQVASGVAGSSRSKEYGETIRYEIHGNYRIKTTNGTCRFDFHYVVTNKAEPEEVGLYWIFVRPDDDERYNGGSGYNIYVYQFDE